jgi:hypothetical protein
MIVFCVFVRRREVVSRLCSGGWLVLLLRSLLVWAAGLSLVSFGDLVVRTIHWLRIVIVALL